MSQLSRAPASANAMAKVLIFFVTALAMALTISGTTLAQQPIRAARSVHLAYYAPPAVLFYNEVTVQNVVRSSYFQVCGFGHGYFGIQELSNGKRRVLFSVWDAADFERGTHDPSLMTEVATKGDGVTAGRFGGEGTGAQSYFEYPWKEGVTYRFIVKAEVQGKRTAFSGYFYDNDSHKWRLVSTIKTPTKGDILKGLYSFVEDFRRDIKSVTERRCAHYGNGWVKTPKGQWVEITKAIFTADATPLDNIQGSVNGARFTLATGGSSLSFVHPYENLSHRPSGNKPPNDLPPEIDPSAKLSQPEITARP